MASHGSNGDYFGQSLAIEGDTVIIDAYLDDTEKGYDSGSAYIFQEVRGIWEQRAKLIASDGAASDFFGWSVAIDGYTAVVGARGDDDKGSNSGSAYIFRDAGGPWEKQAKLTASDGVALDVFCWSVAIDGGVVIVGAQNDSEGAIPNYKGSAYIFQKTSSREWQEAAKLTASDDSLWLFWPSIGDFAFVLCTNLTGVHFEGNAPLGASVFGCADDDNVIVYYLPGTIGWGSTFSGRPTAVWVLPNPLILNFGHGFGPQTNGFGFTISWATNVSVVVEVCADLSVPVWSPQQTNSLAAGSCCFSDPHWTNHPARFYRVRWP